MGLGSRLRQAREDRGLTQEQVAAAAGVSRVTITQWEGEQTDKVGAVAFLKACRLIGADPYEIAFGDEKKQKRDRTTIQREFLNSYSLLSRTEQDSVLITLLRQTRDPISKGGFVGLADNEELIDLIQAEIKADKSGDFQKEIKKLVSGKK